MASDTASKRNGNGATWLKAWRGAMASLMVAAIIAAWHAKGEFAGLRVAVEGIQTSVEKIDERVLYLERERFGGTRR